MSLSPEALAAAEAAADTTAAVNAVAAAETIAAVVAEANEQVNEANETAAQLAAAALENARGEKLIAIENEVSLCRQEIRTLTESLEAIRNQISEIMSRPPEIAIIQPPAKSSSTLPASGGTAETVTVETATINPSESVDAPLDQVANQILPPAKRRRLI